LNNNWFCTGVKGIRRLSRSQRYRTYLCIAISLADQRQDRKIPLFNEEHIFLNVWQNPAELEKEIAGFVLWYNSRRYPASLHKFLNDNYDEVFRVDRRVLLVMAFMGLQNSLVN